MDKNILFDNQANANHKRVYNTGLVKEFSLLRKFKALDPNLGKPSFWTLSPINACVDANKAVLVLVKAQTRDKVKHHEV